MISGLLYWLGNRRADSERDLVLHGLVCFLAQTVSQVALYLREFFLVAMGSVDVVRLVAGDNGAKILGFVCRRSYGSPEIRHPDGTLGTSLRTISSKAKHGTVSGSVLWPRLCSAVWTIMGWIRFGSPGGDLFGHQRISGIRSGIRSSTQMWVSLATTTGFGMTASGARGTAGTWSRH